MFIKKLMKIEERIILRKAFECLKVFKYPIEEEKEEEKETSNENIEDKNDKSLFDDSMISDIKPSK